LCNLQIFLLFLIEFPKFFVSLQHFNSSNYGKIYPSCSARTIGLILR
jgi:hypothetical protein